MKIQTAAFLALTTLFAFGCSSTDVKPVNSSGGVVADAGPGPTPDSGVPVTKKDIVDTAIANGSFKTLVALVGAAGLAETLKGAGPFTVLAPTDAAFAKLEAANPGISAELQKPASKALLTKILTYHVIGAKADSKAVIALDKKAAGSLEGENLRIDIVSSKVVINKGANESTVSTPDVEATNGIIHVVDTVILPPTFLAKDDIIATATSPGAAALGPFTTLAAALTGADLITTLQGPGPFTVFAPTDAAFAKLGAGAPTGEALKQILLFHVSPGLAGSVKVTTAADLPTVNGKKVAFAGGKLNGEAGFTTTDIACKNGIIHVIDTVIVPK
jgi:transforming growth factor-beta-induced protein